MHFAIFCLISLALASDAGPLPRLKHRIPRSRMKLEPIQVGPGSENYRKFDSIVHFQEPVDEEDEIKSLFGGKDVIYLTKKKDNTKRNILLNIVEQGIKDEELNYQDNDGKYVNQDSDVNQDSSDVMKLFMGMKRGLRRYGEPNFVYDFNELVTK